MSVIWKKPGTLFLLPLLAMPATTGLSAQELAPADAEDLTVIGTLPDDLSGLPEGPELEGLITAHDAGRLQVTLDDGSSTVVAIGEVTEVRATGGFLGLDRDKLSRDDLLNGLPVSVETVKWGSGLAATRIDLKSKDLKTAAMIRGGTSQQFARQGAAIEKNAAATEALRGRFGDIDQYNVKGATNVYFDTGKAVLSPAAKADLCATAADADAMNNALLLVVGYTDSDGSQEYNQALSEKRAGNVVNYLQQSCGWKPYRMLTPTGMSEADPLADNATPEGKAQNRRVTVNIMVSKSVEGL